MFLVLGWYSFENVALSVMAVVVAILAVIGMFSRRFLDSFNRGFDKLLGGYKKWTDFFVSHKLISFGFVAASIGVLVWLMSSTATSLVPEEDTGTIMGVVDMPPATAQEKTKRIMDQVDSIAATIPEIEFRTAITGYSFVGGQGNTYGSFIIKLRHWNERKGRQSDCGCGFGRALSEVFGNQRRPHNVLQTAYGKRIFGYQRF